MQKIRSLLFGLFTLFFLPLTLPAQSSNTDPDAILVGKEKRPAIFLVGSFHFAYYNLDAHKTEKDKQVNILSPQKQKEMKELMDYIVRFRPNKIAVESGSNTGYLMARYREYKNGKRPLGKDETEQIGFRLLERFNLDTIYGVNANTLEGDLYDGRDSLVLRPLLDSIYQDWDFKSNDSISARYRRFYSYNDRLAREMSLLQYFRYSNSDKVLNRGFGAYLNGDFNLGKTRGADALAMHWYARNLRIYRHIQQMSTSPNDRILVLFGRGHIEILKHLFDCSPQFELIRFGDLK